MRRYFILIAALVALLPSYVVAQNDYQSETIYNNVAQYVQQEQATNYVSPNLSINITKPNDLRVGISFPGLFQILLMDVWTDVEPSTTVDSMSDVLAQYRYYWGREMLSPVFTLEYTRGVNEWFGLGVKASALSKWRNRYHVYTDEKIDSWNSTFLIFSVNARFSWLRRDVVQMYSSLGLGVAYMMGRDSFTSPYYDVTYVGLSVGRGFFGYFELGGGQSGVFRAGIGTRF